MNMESFRDLCLSRPGVTESFPFNDHTLVFKVMGKMFALADVDLFDAITLKNTPERVVELQEKYLAVQPGYHMNKRHWITVALDDSIPDPEVKRWIDESYRLVVSGLGKRNAAKLGVL